MEEGLSVSKNCRESTSKSTDYVKKSRNNTITEKRRMRNVRKRKKRLQKLRGRPEIKSLTEELSKQKLIRGELEKQSQLNRNMAKTFWERWRYELEERKKLQREVFQKHSKGSMTLHCQPATATIPLINRSLLTVPDGYSSAIDAYVGRGSFGVVKHQLYRGINVAVKEFLPRTCPESVYKEAKFLLQFSHPYLPLLLGICMSKEPFYMVMQYYGIDGRSVTLQRELFYDHHITTYKLWLVLAAQIVEAVRYLHEDVEIIHNDLKTDNILLTRSFNGGKLSEELSSEYQIIIIDFGKASNITGGIKYNLSASEKQKYYNNFTHIAPEVIEGKTTQNVKSDIFALGKLLMKTYVRMEELMVDGVDINFIELKECIIKCSLIDTALRPRIIELANSYKAVLLKTY